MSATGFGRFNCRYRRGVCSHPVCGADTIEVVADPTLATDEMCPHCGGQGQVFFDTEPTFCLPCEGTGLRAPH